MPSSTSPPFFPYSLKFASLGLFGSRAYIPASGRKNCGSMEVYVDVTVKCPKCGHEFEKEVCAEIDPPEYDEP